MIGALANAYHSSRTWYTNSYEKSAMKLIVDSESIEDGVVPRAKASAKKPRSKPPRISGRPTNGYAYGYCTYYVATRKSIPQNWGNAESWLGAAQAAGYQTGSVPKPGAIAWTYGHVAYVEKVSGGKVLISEMNAPVWNQVSHRWAAPGEFRYIY